MFSQGVFYTYIMASRYNGTLYTGQTADVWARSFSHEVGESAGGFTSAYDVTHLVWFEEHPTRHAAFVRERRIKKWKRAWKLELINNFNPLWLSLRECPTWPVPRPDQELLSGVRARCIACSLRPEIRGNGSWETEQGTVDWPRPSDVQSNRDELDGLGPRFRGDD